MIKAALVGILGAAVLAGCGVDERDQYIGCWTKEEKGLPSVLKIEYGPGGKSQMRMHGKSFPGAFFNPRKLNENSTDFVAPENGRPYMDIPMMGRVEMILHENKSVLSIGDKSYVRVDCSRWYEFDQEWEKEYERRNAQPRLKM